MPYRTVEANLLHSCVGHKIRAAVADGEYGMRETVACVLWQGPGHSTRGHCGGIFPSVGAKSIQAAKNGISHIESTTSQRRNSCQGRYFAFVLGRISAEKELELIPISKTSKIGRLLNKTVFCSERLL